MKERGLVAAIMAVCVLCASVFFKDPNLLWFWLLLLFVV